MKLLETMYTKITKVINKVLSRFIIPDKQYQNIKDLNVDEIMELVNKNIPKGCCGGCTWFLEHLTNKNKYATIQE